MLLTFAFLGLYTPNTNIYTGLLTVLRVHSFNMSFCLKSALFRLLSLSGTFWSIQASGLSLVISAANLSGKALIQPPTPIKNLKFHIVLLEFYTVQTHTNRLFSGSSTKGRGLEGKLGKPLLFCASFPFPERSDHIYLRVH